MLLNKILIFLHKLVGADYHTFDVTVNYGNKIAKHKTVKKFEIKLTAIPLALDDGFQCSHRADT